MGVRQLPYQKGTGKPQFAGSDSGSSGGGSYTLPVASSDTLGGVKVGARLSIDSSGVLSASDQSTPLATSETAGKVKPDGTSITVDSSGEISSHYTLPTAAADTLGGVKVGSGLSITDGVLSASVTSVESITITNSSNSESIEGFKYGKIAFINGTTNQISPSTWTVIGQVDNNSLPKNGNFAVICEDSSITKIGKVKISANGEISCYHGDTGSNLYLHYTLIYLMN